MFEKTKERVKKFEETHETFRNAKKHVEKHKTAYACGATGIVCIFGTRTFARPTVITNIIEQAGPIVAPVFNNHNIGNVVNTTVNNGGHMRKIIRCIETDEMWPSMKAAAEATGNTLVNMSKHCNGHTDHLYGMHYAIEGLATG